MFRTIILCGKRQPYCFHNTYMEHKGSQCLICIPGKKGNSQAVEDYKLIYETLAGFSVLLSERRLTL